MFRQVTRRGGPSDWFFWQWVYGTDIPTYVRLGPFEYRPQSIVFNDRDAVLTRRTEAADRIAETPAPR